MRLPVPSALKLKLPAIVAILNPEKPVILCGELLKPHHIQHVSSMIA
jgi:hypothetical protein